MKLNTDFAISERTHAGCVGPFFFPEENALQGTLYDTCTHISSKHDLFDLKLKEVWQYRELIALFTKRNFKVAYMQTILGPLWLFINPMLTSITHLIVFGNIAKLGTDGIPQLLFYFSGNAIWGFFSSGVSGNASTFTSHAGLFGKVYFPRLTIPISNVLSNVIRFLIQMSIIAVLIIYYFCMGLIIVRPLHLLLLPLILLWLGIMGMGCGIILSSLTTKYRDLSVLVGFGMSLWMYGTPVVYPLSMLTGTLRQLIILNPVTMPVELFRWAILGTGTLDVRYIITSLVFTAIVFLLGVVMFNRVERTFMDTV